MNAPSIVEPPTSWTPLLAHAPSEVEATVGAIADALIELTGAGALTDVSLGAGGAGVGLLLAYWSGYLDERAPEESERVWAHCEALLERGATVLAQTRSNSSLFTGYTGVAWVIQHLSGRPDSCEEDPLAELDRGLLTDIGDPSRPSSFDLVDGLAGVLVYARERGVAPFVSQILESLVGLGEPGHPVGRTWFTPPSLLFGNGRTSSPKGHHDLGIAHGVPGVIACLAGVIRDGIAPPGTEQVLADAVRWLLAQPTLEGEGGRYPAMLRPDAEALAPTRLAWCYGDLAVASALLQAGAALDEPTWVEEAVTLATAATHRAPTKTGVVDASLCHGAAGIAHILARMHAATGSAACAEAARRWYADTLAWRQPGAGVAGFEYCQYEPTRMRADPGLLEGAAGIGLSLLASIDEHAPDWDSLLALS